MFDILLPFKQFFKLKCTTIDNLIFRLHYKVTLIILLISILMLSSKQFFGNPIHCLGAGVITNQDAVNSFCWVYGTYSLFNKDTSGNTYPGVGTSRKGDLEVRHTYYQWVVVMLLLQAGMFYLPRLLWKCWEEGRLNSLVANLSGPIIPAEWGDYRRDQLISYFNYTSSYTHNVYCLKYAFCELLNLTNVIGQIFLIDKFLGGAFRDYGSAISSFTSIPELPITGAAISPLERYFPKLTQCKLLTFSATGQRISDERLCVLPLNIVNEKVFAVLWFWFIILSTVSALSIVFRLLVINVPRLQTYMLLGQLRIPYNPYSLNSMLKRYGFGGYFVLHLLGKNMNPLIFKELVNELARETKLKKENEKNIDCCDSYEKV